MVFFPMKVSKSSAKDPQEQTGLARTTTFNPVGFGFAGTNCTQTSKWNNLLTNTNLYWASRWRQPWWTLFRTGPISHGGSFFFSFSGKSKSLTTVSEDLFSWKGSRVVESATTGTLVLAAQYMAQHLGPPHQSPHPPLSASVNFHLLKDLCLNFPLILFRILSASVRELSEKKKN